MKLYHGSTINIEQIDLSKSKPNKDFGKGFYLSAEEEQAREMAVYKALQLDLEPIINVYEFDERMFEGSVELKVKQFSTYDEEWAEFIFANRNNTSTQPIHDYDIVVGPIANDRVGVQIRHYMERNIDLSTFIERLKYMKGITFQYFFGTERAIKLLKKV
ncbi:DUF3990 domain-containing protein [Bacteroides sp. GM023]|uniref:DUF3990 domain-containing protein n=1 Tax=Bacteroides sp. GM023 TaxID=2723058 RepID=UPI00168B70C3|nr:DUF3990 domain-containing protein [Bacteroides sp. GM023]MBD3592689.1 DUF3990 domain-containing protein [Bacteroides sp. GM023]